MEQNRKQERRVKPREGPEPWFEPLPVRLGRCVLGRERLDEGGKKTILELLVLQSPSGALDGPNVLVRIPPGAFFRQD